jgi:Fur family ferric uptake transcriptional regulator
MSRTPVVPTSAAATSRAKPTSVKPGAVVVQPASRGLMTRVRSTRQGALLEVVLSEATGFRSAQELHAELRRRGDAVGLTTVYRHLTNLAEAGAVDVMHADDGETLYRRCGTESHHHHVVCRFCGASVEVDGPEVEAWAEYVAKDAGYVEVSHTLEIVGTCSVCAKTRR